MANFVPKQTIVFSSQFSDYQVVMAMDNASWHSSNIDKNIDNTVPFFQPPHSPEVNPAEHIWQYIRESSNFKNKTLKIV
ncbi:MAG: transposase [Bacteroidales bacterium]|jgi:transposase|nr:transposase [Bacteroidales bacterium]